MTFCVTDISGPTALKSSKSQGWSQQKSYLQLTESYVKSTRVWQTVLTQQHIDDVLPIIWENASKTQVSTGFYMNAEIEKKTLKLPWNKLQA